MDRAVLAEREVRRIQSLLESTRGELKVAQDHRFQVEEVPVLTTNDIPILPTDANDAVIIDLLLPRIQEYHPSDDYKILHPWYWQSV